jgi:hypothetical protein
MRKDVTPLVRRGFVSRSFRYHERGEPEAEEQEEEEEEDFEEEQSWRRATGRTATDDRAAWRAAVLAAASIWSWRSWNLSVQGC